MMMAMIKLFVSYASKHTVSRHYVKHSFLNTVIRFSFVNKFQNTILNTSQSRVVRIYIVCTQNKSNGFMGKYPIKTKIEINGKFWSRCPILTILDVKYLPQLVCDAENKLKRFKQIVANNFIKP